ncbi:MAG TPA: response regulator [Opitutaceae bacterium]|nr:response regulator [Opitutaceae bacterium]
MAKVLILEDDPRIANYLAELVLATGHVPLAVDAAERAQSLLETEPAIELLILDYHLGPESTTGLAFLGALRNSGRHQRLPVIVCSGETKPAAVTGFLSLNIVDFVKKPFRPERLIGDIERALGARVPAVENKSPGTRIIRARD